MNRHEVRSELMEESLYVLEMLKMTIVMKDVGG